jgi:hypothetical protein
VNLVPSTIEDTPSAKVTGQREPPRKVRASLASVDCLPYIPNNPSFQMDIAEMKRRAAAKAKEAARAFHPALKNLVDDVDCMQKHLGISVRQKKADERGLLVTVVVAGPTMTHIHAANGSRLRGCFSVFMWLPLCVSFFERDQNAH